MDVESGTNSGDAGVDGAAESIDDLIDVEFADDERRREQHVIALHTVDRAAHRVAEQALAHRRGLYLRMQPRLGIERLLGLAVCDELDAGEKTASANIADVRVCIELRMERAKEVRTTAAHCIEQTVPFDHLLDGKRGGRSDRMADVRMAVLERAAAVAQRLHDPLMRQHGADRLI